MVKIICMENGDSNRTEVALSGGMDLVVSQIGYHLHERARAGQERRRGVPC